MEDQRRQIPDRLTIDLYQPGMNMLSQAGLGGLAATLQSWTKAIEEGECERPENSDWQITDRSVTLIWGGKPGAAGKFFAALYAYAFRIHDGLIDMPGTYEYGRRPQTKILAEMQKCILCTLLQHCKSREFTGQLIEEFEEIEDQRIPIAYRFITSYKHQFAWSELVDNKRFNLNEKIKVNGMISPGFIKRHEQFDESIILLQPSIAIALHFSIVGTFSLMIADRVATLIVPSVESLLQFAQKRYRITPRSIRNFHINSSGEAVMETEVRIRGESLARMVNADQISVVEFRQPAWNKQIIRSAVHIYEIGEKQLQFFNHIMRMEEFQPHAASGKATKKNEEPRSFFAKSSVKPLLAENIASGFKWYRNFHSLFVEADGRSSEELWRRLSYDQKGLNKMVEDPDICRHWADRGEIAFVRSIHAAMKNRYREIYDDAEHDKLAPENRIKRQNQRWRLSLINAKTQSDFSRALATLWSNSFINKELQSNWKEILPLILDSQHWSLMRDLTLFALASYPTKGIEAADEDVTES